MTKCGMKENTSVILGDLSSCDIHRTLSRWNCGQTGSSISRDLRSAGQKPTVLVGSIPNVVRGTLSINQECDGRSDLPRHTSS